MGYGCKKWERVVPDSRHALLLQCNTAPVLNYSYWKIAQKKNNEHYIMPFQNIYNCSCADCGPPTEINIAEECEIYHRRETEAVKVGKVDCWRLPHRSGNVQPIRAGRSRSDLYPPQHFLLQSAFLPFNVTSWGRLVPEGPITPDPAARSIRFRNVSPGDQGLFSKSISYCVLQPVTKVASPPKPGKSISASLTSVRQSTA